MGRLIPPPAISWLSDHGINGGGMRANQTRRSHQAQEHFLSKIHQHIRLLCFRASTRAPYVMGSPLFRSPQARPRSPSMGHPGRPCTFYAMPKLNNFYNYRQLEHSSEKIQPSRRTPWTHTKVRIHLSCLPCPGSWLHEVNTIKKIRKSPGF